MASVEFEKLVFVYFYLRACLDDRLPLFVKILFIEQLRASLSFLTSPSVTAVVTSLYTFNATFILHNLKLHKFEHTILRSATIPQTDKNPLRRYRSRV